MATPTIAAILGYTDDPQLQAAMALGAKLEGGWSPPFAPGDFGTSFGPYQIHLPAHPGVTEADADNPAWATRFMGSSYSGALQSDQAFAIDPEAAAEQTAFGAERPAADYVSARGQNAVDAAWTQTMLALPPTSVAALKQGGGGGGGLLDKLGSAGKEVVDPGGIAGKAGHLITGAGGAAAGAIGDVIGGAFGAVWDDAKPFLVTMGFVGLGLSLIAAGLVISTRGSRSSSTTTLPALPVGGSGPAGGGAAAGGAAAGGGASAAELAPLALA